MFSITLLSSVNIYDSLLCCDVQGSCSSISSGRTIVSVLLSQKICSTLCPFALLKVNYCMHFGLMFTSLCFFVPFTFIHFFNIPHLESISVQFLHFNNLLVQNLFFFLKHVFFFLKCLKRVSHLKSFVLFPRSIISSSSVSSPISSVEELSSAVTCNVQKCVSNFTQNPKISISGGGGG